MGWASATELVDNIWKEVENYIPLHTRKEVARSIMEIFQKRDWDTYQESEMVQKYNLALTCQTCVSDRIVSLDLKHSDSCNVTIYYLNDKKINGYVPTIPNVCRGDYTKFTMCLECGQIQGEWPIILEDEE